MPRYFLPFLGRRRFPFLAAFVLLLPLGSAGAPERIAVWNPVNGTGQPANRLVIDLDYLDRVGTWLKEGHLDVARLTTEELNEPSRFSAAEFAALVMPGDAFPRSNLEAIKRFTDDGGVLIGLNGRTPFVVAIGQKPDGSWTMSPEQPYMKWQSSELIGHLGLRYAYDPARHDQAFRITPSALLKSYLPQAPKVIERPFGGMWIVPTAGTRIYPLLRSQRVDGADVPPQIMLAAKEKRRAIICLNGLFTSEKEPEVWAFGKETVVAIARLARDLRGGKIDLTQAVSINLPADLPASEPLRNRRSLASVQPVSALMVTRWGKFDGSSFDLGDFPAGAQEVVLGMDAILPRILPPGASLTLPIPIASVAAPDSPLYLRVRGGYSKSGAGLRIDAGGQAFWNELFVQVDATGAGNFAKKIEGELPTEFQRVCFVAPGQDGLVRVSNPGDAPLYFDAIQLERHPSTGEPVYIGPMQTDLSSTQDKVSRELTSQWNLVRCNVRSNLIGPPEDPNRFAVTDKLFKNFLRTGTRIHLLLEGTPEWAAVSSERYAAGEKIRRGRAVPPDTEKYAQLVRDIVTRYGEHVFAYEIWNEPDVGQFWNGTVEEYSAFLIRIAALLREVAPRAPIISAGMASYHEDFVTKLHELGGFAAVDWIGFHPYAGTSSGWDVSFGRLEGKLFSLGVNKPIYCDESGFVHRQGEWFKGVYNVEVQHDLLEKAMGRLLAGDTTRLNIFHATASGHHFDLLAADGTPRPAYGVLAEYVKLGQRDGRRLETGLTAEDGSPVQGIYRMAARHADGSVTIVLNPGDAPSLQRVYGPSNELNSSDGWITFFGKSEWKDGTALVIPSVGRDYAGFFTKVSANAGLLPFLEVSVPECTGYWDLVLKFSDKTSVPLARRKTAGVFRINYSELIKRGDFSDAELAFRVHGGPARIDYVRFLSKDGGAASASAPLHVKLLVPWSGPVTAKAGASLLQAEPKTSGASSWVELTVPVSGLTTISLTKPSP